MATVYLQVGLYLLYTCAYTYLYLRLWSQSTYWRYTNSFIIIIIILTFGTPFPREPKN